MTTVNNRNVPLRDSRAIRNVSPPSGKDEGPKQKGFLNRPRRWLGGKSFWDWLTTILIPLAVVGATIGFGWWQGQLADMQHQNDQQIALDQQRATTLQTYLSDIQDLLLNHNLLGNLKPAYHGKILGEDTAVEVLAQARTDTALQGLDTERKGRLVEFLYDAHLIGFYDANHRTSYGPIIGLGNTNLSGVDLHDEWLLGINLSSANLSGANLSGAVRREVT